MRTNGRPRKIESRRVLVVDDDAISREVLTAMLSIDDHIVSQAANRDRALALLADPSREPFHPDAVFADLLMPGPPIPEFAARVRALQSPCPQLIAMSATAAEPSQWQGFDRFLLKPVTMKSLRAALEAPRTDRGAPRLGHGRKNSPPPAPPEPRNGTIDLMVLRKLQQAMPSESLRELYRACVDDSRARISALRELAQSGHASELRPGAHQIKGAAAMVGAARLAALAKSLELGSYDKEDSLRQLGEMDAECRRIERMLLTDIGDLLDS